MPSVADMLRWKLPSILIMIVVVLQVATPDTTSGPALDFAEIFAGVAKISKSLRNVLNKYLVKCSIFPPQGSKSRKKHMVLYQYFFL